MDIVLTKGDVFMNYETGTCPNCGGRLYYIYCYDKIKCEENCKEESDSLILGI